MYPPLLAQTAGDQGPALLLAIVFAILLAWLRHRNDQHAFRFAVAGVIVIAAVAAYNAPVGQGALMFVIVLIGGTATAYVIWLMSGVALAAAGVEPTDSSKIPTSHWTGLIASILEDIIAHDSLQALRTAAVIVRRSDNGIGATWSHDGSRATVPTDPDILAYCYVKDAEEFGRTWSTLESIFARGDTKESDRRVFVDFLGASVANRLEEIVNESAHKSA